MPHRLHFITAMLMLLFGCSGSDASPIDAGITRDASAIADASSQMEEDASAPSIEWGACPSGFRDQCAILREPLDHAHPNGEKIDVLISRRGTGTKQLWLLQGGPGASAEAFYGLHNFLTSLDPTLEVYTMEHRGVGESTRIGCDEEGPSTPLGFQLTDEEWPECLAEVEGNWGSRLAYFNATEAAHDLASAIAMTRRQGVPVFVYGGSYGTFLANRFGVLHPDTADGLILDAPVQPGSHLDYWDLQFEPMGRRIFGELCPAAPRCAEHLGSDPLAFLDRVVASLKEGHCSELGVDFPTWQVVFGLALMDYNLRNWLPAIVYRLDRCSPEDQTALATLFSALFGGGGAADGAPAVGVPRKSSVLQMHIALSELFSRTHVDDSSVIAARMNNTFFQDAMRPAYLLQDSWPRYAEDPRASQYAPPTLPVLTLAGADDPSAPPAAVGYGYRDHLTGPHQTFVEIPYGAHTVLSSAGSVGSGRPSCPVQLVRAFLADPTSTLPVECAAQVLTPSFDAPQAYLDAYWGTSDLYD